MPAARTTRSDLETEQAGPGTGRLGALLVAAFFLALGIGGGLMAWLRQNQGAGIEEVLSALAIAVVGVLAAIVHGRAVIVLQRARQTERQIEREHIATRAALDRAAAVPPLAEALREDIAQGHGPPGSHRGQDDLLSWQIAQVAGNIEADVALIRDLKRIHGEAKLTKAWRSSSSEVARAVAELSELASPRKP